LRALIAREAPDIIVNPAAYTAVDKAETDTQVAEAVNVRAPMVMAEEARKLGALLVHYSTDYVFDGTKVEPYTESDIPCPKSVYGSTKLGGETAIRDSGVDHLIFRTSWVFGAKGGNFLKTMLRLARERDTLNVVADQWGAPTPASLIADVTSHTVGQILRGHLRREDVCGTYHLASEGSTNWHEYATYGIEYARALGDTIKVSSDGIRPIATIEYPTPAARPLNSRLATDKLRQTFALALPHWQAGVRQVLELIV
jgi:dTDP-4-dehydrorhamnose reductase